MSLFLVAAVWAVASDLAYICRSFDRTARAGSARAAGGDVDAAGFCDGGQHLGVYLLRDLRVADAVSRLFVIGLSHRTAPLTMRESLAVPDSELSDRLQAAASLCGEAMLLSTCNRVELYVSLGDESAVGKLRKLVTQSQPDAERHLYEKQGTRSGRTPVPRGVEP